MYSLLVMGGKLDRVKDYWINSARYDWYKARVKGNIFERAFYNWKIKYILSLANFRGKKILDMGCGTGVNTYDLYRKSRDVVGIDLSSWAINKAKENFPEVNFQVMNSEKTSFPDNHFDIIVNTGLIQYLENPSLTVKEMYRILKPGGIIIVEVPWKHSIYNSMFVRRFVTGKKNPNDEPINRTYNSRGLRRLFSEFKCKKIRQFIFIVLYGVFKK